MSEIKTIVKDINDMPWDELVSERTGKKMIEKKLLNDPDTGMLINYCHYPEGFVTPWHIHHDLAHGIYVLEGTLYTHEGSYGPGSFVWFPEGIVAEHGAVAEGGATVLFITNKPFNIEYIDKE
ncbi:hypothetical protein A8L34_02885 [Bacillus sp. FJAT-27264]|uniref:cupin domain-containing protein n=1 Tax=Paenibacillus sp. (strain DSM 101736 / FJAT-27264) TaxID=1850362 RepID=UPI000807D3E9|nr:cupin domain-containing protein [Bacillus sp. FJAT-27264]OBZ18540.1 hypothetical protein A8L34_02885 [Bacillus sp. FJAT-27264]